MDVGRVRGSRRNTRKGWKGQEVMTTDALIRNLAFNDEKDIPQAEMDRRAKAAIEGELGGCSELLKIQREFWRGTAIHPNGRPNLTSSAPWSRASMSTAPLTTRSSRWIIAERAS